jgi:hypothetical protein
MSRNVRLLLGAGSLLVGVVVFLAMTVYPFQYGTVESAVLAGAVVLYLALQSNSEDDML